MAAGLTATLNKQQLDAQMGSICAGLDGVMLQIQQMRQYLLATVDATLTGAQFGYVQGDVNTFKSTFVDLDLLRQIYQGTANLTTAQDFRANAKLIFGTGVH